jgi:hypothetical protein
LTIPTKPEKSVLGRLEALEQFLVYDNRLTASLPEVCQDLTNLEYFWFDGTNLTGSVDTIFCINPFVSFLRGDCLGDLPEITCTCCTSCCTAEEEMCEQAYWAMRERKQIFCVDQNRSKV